LTGAPLDFAVVTAIGSPLQALAAVWLLRRLASFDRSFGRIRDVLWFVGLAAGLSPVISATIGLAALHLAGLTTWSGSAGIWLVWWCSDAMGVLLVAPLLLTLPDWRGENWLPGRIAESGFLLLGTAIFCLWVYLDTGDLEMVGPLTYLAFPFVIWAGVRFEQRGAAVVIFITTAVVVWVTASGRGPFAQGEVHASLSSLYGYLSVLGAAGMLLAAAVAERRRALAAAEISHGTLEKTVRLRTEELAAANARLRAQIGKSRRAESALRESEERLRQATQLAGLGYYVWDAVADRCLYCSEEHARIHGTTVEEYISRACTIDGEFLFTHPEDRQRVRAAFKALRAGHPIEMEYRVLTSDGETRHVREIARPVFDDGGTVVQEYGTIQNVTELKQVESKLRQTQKMEAVGHLTGGVAHDFNNLLAVIMGNAELLHQRHGEDHRPTQAILRAASRGAELTQQLLAFSRKQPLHPHTIKVNDIVSEMLDLLKRTLGETIEIRTFTIRGLWSTSADSGQLENALLNLAINARDAMPDGGVLTIETSNAYLEDRDVDPRLDIGPGPYVVLAVGDTGSGMSEELAEKAFEPFFTTKDIGKGSGLGLSMVYGFVKQTGGHVTIDSTPGRGTTVKLYLPRVFEAVTMPKSDKMAEPRGRGQTILVLEDDPDVRKLAVSMLQGLGYSVREAHDGRAALEVFDSASRIDLLLSDIVLSGGISGRAVVEQARGRRPDLKVLFMSGYAEAATNREGLGHDDTVVLNKPFRRHELAQKVSSALMAAPGEAGLTIPLAS
jgi:PAS domain S-box-containing protein